ncbi:MAG: hypothetical protein E7K64_01295 [Clostridia bacterium]|nr:hypothetical protein [Peptococcus niger]MDU7245622.1 hypothetical protein [Clostridiales bacterium]MDU7504669.1 hypothetical protein [Clostridia bacterium]
MSAIVVYPPEIENIHQEIKPYRGQDKVPREIEEKRRRFNAWIEEKEKLQKKLMDQ